MKMRMVAVLWHVLLMTAVFASGCDGDSAVRDGGESAAVPDGVRDIERTEPAYLNLTFPDYPEQWKQYNALKKAGRLRSACDIIDEVRQRAESDGNAAQFVRAVMKGMSCEKKLQDRTAPEIIRKLHEVTDAAEFPARQVLMSYLAQMYRSYYQRNYYRIRSRDRRSDAEDVSVEELGMRGMYERTRDLFLRATTDSRLRQVKIGAFHDILETGTLPRSFRPTLYDLLVHRALDFLTADDPATYAFGNSAPSPFSPVLYARADHFVFADIEKLSHGDVDYRMSLELFRDLLLEHLRTGRTDAAVYTDLRRLRYVRGVTGRSGIDEQYVKAVRHLRDAAECSPAARSMITADIARYYKQIGDRYSTVNGTERERLSYRKAAEICRGLVSGKTDLPGEQRCARMLNEMERKHVALNVASAVADQRPILTHVAFRNVSELYFRIHRLDKAMRGHFHRYGTASETALEKILARRPLRTRNVTLPDDGDMQHHTTEIALDPLPSGRYLLIAGTAPSFSRQKNAIFHVPFTVSGMTFSQRPTGKNGLEIVVADRSDGKFLSGVGVELVSGHYDHANRVMQYRTVSRGRTDSTGSVVLRKPDRHIGYRVRIRLTHGDERVMLPFSGSFSAGRAENNGPFLRFFTDRSVYRPGQTVHFRAILFSRHKDGDPHVLPGRTVQVRLQDPGRKETEKVSLKTGAFGSISGSFKLSDEMRPGTVTLSSQYGYAHITVESYKRPVFRVSFDKTATTGAIGDVIPVHGSAETWAGVPVAGADVSYSVERSVVLQNTRPSDMRQQFFAGIIGAGNRRNIARGTVRTDKDGSFSFRFTGRELQGEEERDLLHSYHITVRVTDSRGETRTARTWMVAGRKTVRLSVSVPEHVLSGGAFSPDIVTTDLNGVPVERTGRITIRRVKRRDTFFRKRWWNPPDRPLMDERTFTDKFPDMQFRSPAKSFEPGTTVHTASFDTGSEQKVHITPDDSWTPGEYVIVVTTEDSQGETVRDRQLFVLHNPETDDADVRRHVTVFPEQKSTVVGDTVRFFLSSAHDDAYLRFTLDSRDRTPETRIIHLDAGKVTVEEVLPDNHRGDLWYSWLLIRDGRQYSGQSSVSVKREDTELDVTVESFTDVMNPGEETTWTVRVQTPDESPADAEFAATLFDNSLSLYRNHTWMFRPRGQYYSVISWRQSGRRANASRYLGQGWHTYRGHTALTGDRLRVFDPSLIVPIGVFSAGRLRRRAVFGGGGYGVSASRGSGGIVSTTAKQTAADKSVKREQTPTAEARSSTRVYEQSASGSLLPESPDRVRTAFHETALFVPGRRTDENGAVSLSFTIPDRITEWRLLGLAHTTDLQVGTVEKTLVTRKELMVTPNMPRFLRSGDTVTLRTDISNISDIAVSGEISLSLTDSISGKSCEADFSTEDTVKRFSAEAGESTEASWTVKVPDNHDVVTWRISARGDTHNDAMEGAIPVRSDTVPVTESVPLYMKSGEKKTISLDGSSGISVSGMRQLTFEYTADPAWHVVFALPRLRKPQRESVPGMMRRIYSDLLGRHILRKNPRVAESIRTLSDDTAPISPLERNSDLKNILLRHTPWVLEAASDTARMRELAEFLDNERINTEVKKLSRRIAATANPDGGFPWFRGMTSSPFITGHILILLGRLRLMDIETHLARSVVQKALYFSDRTMARRYARIKPEDRKDMHITASVFHYLYMRSHFKNFPVAKEHSDAFEYWMGQAEKHWVGRSPHIIALNAVAVYRYGNSAAAAKMLRSLRETAVSSDEKGMYWASDWTWHWFERPLETQAAVIEAFSLITGEKTVIHEMKRWLLRKKRITGWSTSRATADVCHAFLTTGSSWTVGSSLSPNLSFDNTPVKTELTGVQGYVRKTWTPDMLPGETVPGEITVENTGKHPSWAAVYVQSLRQLDEIEQRSGLPLSVKRELYRVHFDKKSERTLVPYSSSDELEPGDRLVVRLILKLDEKMDFIAVESMRPAGFEPIDLRSGTTCGNGTCRYRSITDTGSSFYFSRLLRGTHVVEYELHAVNPGNFSSGMATVQSVYAPEYSSHSGTLRIVVRQ